jgi:hypothetical protein
MPYDDNGQEAVGAGSPSGHVRRQDLLIILAVLLVLAALSAPIYNHFRVRGEIAEDKANLREVFNSMSGYAQDNNDRLPPAYYELGGGTVAHEAGLPVAWPTLVGPGMSSRAKLRARAASPAESAQVLDGKSADRPVLVSYGMYRGLSCAPVGMVPDPTESVLVADSANGGARGSYNPVPLLDPDGRPSKSDAFVLGWDDSNTVFSAGTKAVTRLAIFGAKDGDFETGKAKTRFGTTLYAVTVAGSLRELAPRDAKVRYVYPLLEGEWWANPRIYR